MQAIPSQNYTFADENGRIAYVYNAVFPKRDPAFDWQKYLPGDTSRTLWSEYLPFEAVPQVVDPPSGFVFNANNTPFTATAAADDLKREAFSPTLGIETRVTNRGLAAGGAAERRHLDHARGVSRDQVRQDLFEAIRLWRS